MKKITYFITGILLTLSTTALAATMVFTDQSNFEGSWFEGAAVSMQQKGIINGYQDGSFGPNNSVSRAELAVMLDRYNDYIQGVVNSKIGSNQSNSKSDDTISVSQINRIIHNTLRFADDEFDWYTSFLVMAESGLKELPGRPDLYNSERWKEQENAVLPEGYKLYTVYMQESGNPSYLHFFGEVCIGDVCGNDKDQWYGPFYNE